MAFQLNAKNEAIFSDRLSGTEVLFYYRLPTVAERVAYQNAAVKRTRNDLKFDIAQAHYKYGLKVLEGIRDGDFEIPADIHEGKQSGRIQDDKEFLPISSNKNSQYYVANWKDLVGEYANHLVIALGNLVFGNPAEENQSSTDSD